MELHIGFVGIVAWWLIRLVGEEMKAGMEFYIFYRVVFTLPHCNSWSLSLTQSGIYNVVYYYSHPPVVSEMELPAAAKCSPFQLP